MTSCWAAWKLTTLQEWRSRKLTRPWLVRETAVFLLLGQRVIKCSCSCFSLEVIEKLMSHTGWMSGWELSIVARSVHPSKIQWFFGPTEMNSPWERSISTSVVDALTNSKKFLVRPIYIECHCQTWTEQLKSKSARHFINFQTFLRVSNAYRSYWTTFISALLSDIRDKVENEEVRLSVRAHSSPGWYPH